MTDDSHNEIIRLMTLGSPYHASLAAGRILAAKPTGKEEMAMLLELVDRWIIGFRAMLQYKHRVEDSVAPTIEALYKELTGPFPSTDDEFLSGLDEPRQAPSDSNGKPKLRPSRVPRPGPLDGLIIPQSEDELRHTIIAWQADKDNGRRQPLFWFGREPFWGYGLRQKYLSRSIDRFWVSTKRWEPDLAVIEDILLVNCYFQTRLTTASRNFKAAMAEPLTRKYTVHDCRIAGRRAAWKLEREGLLKKIKPQTWTLTAKGEEAVKAIIAYWGDADKPDEG